MHTVKYMYILRFLFCFFFMKIYKTFFFILYIILSTLSEYINILKFFKRTNTYIKKNN